MCAGLAMLARPPCSATNRTAVFNSPWYRFLEPLRRGVRIEIRWRGDAGCKQPVPWPIRIRNATSGQHARSRRREVRTEPACAWLVSRPPPEPPIQRRPTDGAGVPVLSPESRERVRHARERGVTRPEVVTVPELRLRHATVRPARTPRRCPSSRPPRRAPPRRRTQPRRLRWPPSPPDRRRQDRSAPV
jgi:hypothetical protein